MVLHRWESIKRLSGIINCVDNVIWPPFGVCKLTFRVLALRESNWRNYGLCAGPRYLWEYGDENTGIN